ncbi:unnamed protein product [Didymodactylos carnosus]|uniref:Glycosyl hydrolase family 81 N-terminal domain-containing protein n=1 Tax=Didymodactylos carnosus TaxID=1234261 RepID=A0A815PEP9_9BILA|nr:unnamed protein product [Didymodactylos carnosus]CAF1448101.1 unnamed protein product [Didymodactylos carnosus]CAF3975875.1 unnamed protein product [Didymodactylos carnosus]CAF4322284.1 unnamed protein product [Didymodactylos carnosus]
MSDHYIQINFNSLLGEGYNPIIIHPFVLLMNDESPYCILLSFTEQLIFGQQIDKTRIKYFMHIVLKNIQVSTTEFSAKNFEIIDVDDSGFDLTLKLRQKNSQAPVTMPVVRGITYVTFKYNLATPTISTTHANG